MIRLPTFSKKPLLILFVAAIALYMLFAAVLYAKQSDLIFPATKLEANFEYDFGVPFEELTIPVDGAELNAVHFRQKNPRGLIFFLHGNGGNLDSWASGADYYQRINYDMFMLDYRGYGKSTGSIESESQLHADVMSAWKTIQGEYADKPIVIYGRSLGTALAVELSRQVKPDLLILVSPFTSLLSMAKSQYPFLPSWLVRFPFETDQRIGDLEVPIVLVHGSQDRFIPQSHSHALQELIRSPSRLLVIDGAGHNDIHRFRTYKDGLEAVLP